MQRALPLLVAVVALAGVLALRPGAESGACAQGGAVVERADCDAGVPTSPQACAASREGFSGVRATRLGRGAQLAFTRRVRRPVQIDVFQVAAGRRVLDERLVARFRKRSAGVTWNGRAQRGRPAVRDGVLFARFTLRDERGRTDERRLTLVRRGGRLRVGRDFYRRTSCGTLSAFKLERPVFGGTRGRALGIAFRLARPGTVAVDVRCRGRVVRRFRAARRTARTTHRLRAGARGVPRGTCEIRLVYTGDQGSLTESLYAQRL